MADTINFTTLGLTGTGVVQQTGAKSFNKLSIGAGLQLIAGSLSTSPSLTSINGVAGNGFLYEFGVSTYHIGDLTGVVTTNVNSNGNLTTAFNGNTITGVTSIDTTTFTVNQPSGFTGGNGVQKCAGLQTTNNTPTSIAEIVVNEGEMVTLYGIINGKYSDNSAFVGGRFSVSARRVPVADVVLVGTPELIINQDSTAATFTCDAFVTNESLRILVTGVAGKTINWDTFFIYQKLLLNT